MERINNRQCKVAIPIQRTDTIMGCTYLLQGRSWKRVALSTSTFGWCMTDSCKLERDKHVTIMLSNLPNHNLPSQKRDSRSCFGRFCTSYNVVFAGNVAFAGPNGVSLSHLIHHSSSFFLPFLSFRGWLASSLAHHPFHWVPFRLLKRLFCRENGGDSWWQKAPGLIPDGW